MKLYLIRHGESETNRIACWTGWLDAKLTDKGLCDAELAGKALLGIKFDKVYSSDLERARRTAEIALPGCEYEATPLLREISLGELEGKPIASVTPEIRETLKDGYASIGGESVSMFRTRIVEFLKKMEELPYENVAAFSHGGWLTSALSVVFDLDLPRKNIYCGNCAILTLTYTNGTWRLYGWQNVT